jgi:transposase
MKAYSLDLRERIVQAVADGMPKSVVARLFAVSVATISNYLRQVTATGSLAPRPIPGRPAAIAREQEAAFVAFLRAAPDATLAERISAWAHDHQVTLSPATMSRTIRRVGWRRKKRA